VLTQSTWKDVPCNCGSKSPGIGLSVFVAGVLDTSALAQNAYITNQDSDNISVIVEALRKELAEDMGKSEGSKRPSRERLRELKAAANARHMAMVEKGAPSIATFPEYPDNPGEEHPDHPGRNRHEVFTMQHKSKAPLNSETRSIIPHSPGRRFKIQDFTLGAGVGGTSLSAQKSGANVCCPPFKTTQSRQI
jgi:hypothetical protein